jgi:ketosteroid isomerase-like protein
MSEAALSGAEAELLGLDEAWNEAYRRHDRRPLNDILADDFMGFMPSGEVITKANLVVDPPGRAVSVQFSERSIHVFGDAGVVRGRLQLDLGDAQIDQRFLRVFAKRGGMWRAVSVSVWPVTT